MTGDLVIGAAGESLGLSIGGVHIRFEPTSAAMPLAVPAPHEAFRVAEPSRIDCTVRCEYAEPLLRGTAPDFVPGDAWEMRRLRDGGQEIAFFAGRNSHREIWQTLSFDADVHHGVVRRLPAYGGETAFKVGFPTDEFLFGRLLAKRGAVILHASALLIGENALVFVGHSGAGKSTISRLGEELGAIVLSDDRTILQRRGEVISAWGTPWHGTFRRSAARTGIVQAVYLLEQGSSNIVTPLSTRDALGEMFVRLMHPPDDVSAMNRCLETLEEIACTTRVAKLTFLPAPEAFAMAADWALGGRRDA